MDVEIPVCDACGSELGQKISGVIYYSSGYIGGPLCYECQVEHCLSTNCFACEQGSYPDCEHLARKQYYMEPD